MKETYLSNLAKDNLTLDHSRAMMATHLSVLRHRSFLIQVGMDVIWLSVTSRT